MLLILVTAASCTAMVFVWSNLSDGHPGVALGLQTRKGLRDPYDFE
jgi:ACR3 family arsenite efflux pump ArsB